MGRMLDTLRKSETPRAEMLPAQGVKPHADCVMEWAVNEAQMPYIEVGGPGKVLEGSAEVMAVAHPPQAKQPPHPPVKESFAKSAILAQLTEAKPLTVAYEPWTGPAAGSRGMAAEIIAYHQPTHSVSKQYLDLWNAMIAGAPTAPSQVWLLCGLRPQVGTTTVLLNLAVTGAAQGHRIVVVDAQTRQASVAGRFGFNPDLGLLDVIAGQAALEQTVLKTIVPALQVLPASASRDDVDLSAEGAAWILGRLRQRFDVILIDAPCLTEKDGLLALAPSSDGIFLVAPQGETKSMPRETLQIIARMGGKLRGVLHTHVEM
jgi:Mrp family chromosome partitioning ATPase